jgi:hypothetical protein
MIFAVPLGSPGQVVLDECGFGEHNVEVDDHSILVAPVDGGGLFGQLCDDATARASSGPNRIQRRSDVHAIGD